MADTLFHENCGNNDSWRLLEVVDELAAPDRIVLAVVVLLFGLSVLVVVALAQVPVVTYLRYYALVVLGDVDSDLDLIPDRRGAIRADEGSP